MTETFEQVLQSVWPEWTIVEPISISEASVVFRTKRQEINGISEAAVKVTAFPADVNEMDDMRLSGLSEDAIRLRVEQMTRTYVSHIQLMKSVRSCANILAIEDYRVIPHSETGQWFVLVRMELLTTLQKRLQLAPFTGRDIVRLGMDMCSALEVCSRRSIVHLDINPANIYVNQDGAYKLGNFSTARSLAEMALPDGVMAMQSFIAPETYSAMKESMDYDMYARADIYALGMVMYFLANNRRMPFIPPEKQIASPADRMEAFSRRFRGDALPGLPEIPAQLEAVILKACAYRAEDRYASAAEMRQALQTLYDPGVTDALREEERAPEALTTAYDTPAQGKEKTATPVPVIMNEIRAKPVIREKRRKRLALAMLYVLLAALLILAGFGLYHHLGDGSISQPAVSTGTADPAVQRL